MPLPLPGPDGGTLGLDNVQAFSKEPLDFLLRNRATYGDRYRMDFAGAEVVVLCHPDDIRLVLGPQRDRLQKWQKARVPFERVTPVNLVILEGQVWSPLRSIAETGIGPAGGGAQVTQQVALALGRGEAWAAAKTVDIASQTSLLHRSALCAALLGYDDIALDAPELARALDEQMALFMKDARSPVRPPTWLPTRANRSRRQARRVIDAGFAEAIGARRAGTLGTDVLSGLLSASAGERRLGDAEAAELLLSLFVAGRETPARALTWALHSLAWSADLQDAVAAEVEAVTGGGPLEAAHLGQLALTRQVLLEALRMYPPAWSLVFREVLSPVELPGLTLPVGAVVYMSPWVVHRDPRFWPSPDTFDPTRFAPGWEERAHPYAWLPFGGGPRECVGRRLVLSEGLALIGALVRGWRFTPPSGEQPIPPEGAFTLQPSRPVLLEVARRA